MVKRSYSACYSQEKSERERTIEEFLPIIKHLAYKMSRGFDDSYATDDLISAGVTGLL